MASQLERHRERFESDPSDRAAFQALEEHYFLHGAWTELSALYERHLGAEPVASDTPRAARLRFRLGQILEERRLDASRAIECYREAARLDPKFRQPLSQLRRLHAERGQWEVALQIAEEEVRTSMPPYECADLHCELGRLWYGPLHDSAQAVEQYQAALEAVPDHLDSLTAMAVALEDLGRADEAARFWQLSIDQLRGPDRAPALEALAQLLQGSLSKPERALDLYREALAQDPKRVRSLEALIAAETANERWEEVTPLLESHFDLTSGAQRRAAIALETGRVYADRLDEPDRARHWFERALDLAPEDPRPHLALAELEGRAGNDVLRARHIERAFALGGAEAAPDLVVEASRLALRRGEAEQALEHLRRALNEGGENPHLLAALTEALAPLGRHDELVEVLERRVALAKDASERSALLCQIGEVSEAQLSDPESALAAYERAFAANPTRQELLPTLERLYRKLERWSALEGLLESQRHRLPSAQQVGLLCSLGQFHAGQGRAAEARRYFEQALDHDPAEPRALASLARLALEQGDHQSLLRVYEREAAATQDVERLGGLVGEILTLRRRQGGLEEALGCVKRWGKLAPDDRRPLEALADLQEGTGRSEELLQTLERLDALLPPDARAANRNRLARLHATAGRPESALAAWRSALEADPEDLEALQCILEPLAQYGPLEELVEIRRRLLRRLPPADREACALELAELLAERLGRLDEAIRLLGELQGASEPTTEVDERLDSLLERTGRYEELAQRWADRRSRLAPNDPEGLALDLRRAHLLRDRVGRPVEAAALFRRVRACRPGNREALEGLERCLREVGDTDALVALLAEREREETDAASRARWLLERAMLLDEPLGRWEDARATYERLLDELPQAEEAPEAARRLEALLRRHGAYQALCSRLEERCERATGSERAALHAQIASLASQELDDPSAARLHLEAALELEPGRSEQWRQLAQLHERANRPCEWVAALEGELANEPARDRELTLRTKAAHLLNQVLHEPERAAPHYRRILEIDPTNAEAAEVEIDRLEREERFGEIVALLEARLAASEASLSSASESESMPETRTALRLRIASLRADRLGDLAGARAQLEAAFGELGALPVVAEPLADLYERAGDLPELLALCEEAARCSESPLERADWRLRLGGVLRRSGQMQRAAETYRSVLVDRPDDENAHAALRELYRQLGESGPLARLLEVQLERVGGGDEIPFRRELADLLEGPLERPEEALVHLCRVVEIDRGDRPTRERAIDLAGRLGRAEDALALIDAGLRTTTSRPLRARLQARRAALLAGLGDQRADQAIAAYQESLRLDSEPATTWRALRELFESLGRVPEALGCLEKEQARAAPAERPGLLQHAAQLALSEIGVDAAVPWLERLRALRPGDPQILLQLAHLHRRAGRTELWLRTLEEAAEDLDDPARRRDLHRERARVLRYELAAPRRAVVALEAAQQIDPSHPGVLDELEALYEALGTSERLAGVLETRAAGAEGAQRRHLLVRLAELCFGPLAQPRRGVSVLQSALASDGLPALERLDLLRRLGEAHLRSGELEEFARIAEEELHALPHEPVFEERRRVVEQALAETYRGPLGRPTAALVHLRALADAPSDDPAGQRCRRRAEAELIEVLRQCGPALELARRLGARLEACPEDADVALELARLREERLWAPAAAAAAYRHVLAAHPESREALQGLRRTSERLGDWREAARAIDAELALDDGSAAEDRAARWRHLGEVRWKKLGETTQASRAFAAALEAAPGDLGSLRALQQLLEAMEDWTGCLEFYSSELDLLADSQPERRMGIWLRMAELSEERVGDLGRAAHALDQAARLGPLSGAHRCRWAQLLRRLGDLERYVCVLESWCDEESSEARASDHLDLAQALVEMDRPGEGLSRTERALELDADSAPAWLLCAELRNRTGDLTGAARAWARAGQLARGPEAARSLLRAAECIEPSEPRCAAEWLERAVLEDPALAPAHAARARVAYSLGQSGVALEAASRALQLAETSGTLASAALLETGLFGARAALLAERFDDAARLAAVVLRMEPEHAEALSISAEASFRSGDLPSARDALERVLTQESSGPRAAHHLLMLATTLEQTGEEASALDRYGEALRLNSTLDEAHAGCVRILSTRDPAQAARALLAWAEQTEDPETRAARLVEASEQRGKAGAANEACEAPLREALDAQPNCGRAWERLAVLLWTEGRRDEALQAAESGLAASMEPSLQASLLRIRADALESQGARRDAADAFRALVGLDPRATDAALSGARLLRAQGEWEAAAELLTAFVERHPGNDPAGRSRVFLQLGRLRAGPLEDVEGAIDAYRRAIESDPDLEEAREALAGLLVHAPQRRDEALELHRTLLDSDPTRVASLRALVSLARQRGAQQAAGEGLIILAALGAISPTEPAVADQRLSLRVGARAALSDDLWERMRLMALEASEALARALGASNRTDEGVASDPLAHYRTARLRAEAELAAPALVPLSTAELGETLRLLGHLALDSDCARGDGNLVNSLATALGRRLRRRLKRILGSVEPAQIEAIDYPAWRQELRSLASAVALDATGGQLRNALVALLACEPEFELQALAPETDLSDWIASSPEARDLLGRVVRVWTQCL